jgi:hypothetical protein
MESESAHTGENSAFSMAEVQWLSSTCHNKTVTLKAKMGNLKADCSPEGNVLIASYSELASKFHQYLIRYYSFVGFR